MEKVKRIVFTLIMICLAAAILLYAGAAAETAPATGKPTGTVLPTLTDEKTTREAFFANGTPITIREPKADTEGWVHDEEVQNGLANGYSRIKGREPVL